MTTFFLCQDIWPQLTEAVKSSKQRCNVAVAYFGQGASKLLPLPEGSRLIVDASERAVASGQTCPAELQKLAKKGVVLFSVPNLHAKVFVLGRTAYIGSTNVSGRSAAQLVEAVIRTTEPSAVSAAQQFVRDNCLQELTPELLKKLAKLYRPPKIPGGKQRKKQEKASSDRPTLPRLHLVQIERETWNDRDQNTHESGLAVAKKRRQHSHSYQMESFRCVGKCHYLRGDVVVQVTNEGNGGILVEAPGNVLHVRTRRDGDKRVSFVYLEQPVRRRRQVKSLAATLGCTQKQLRRNYRIRDQAFAQALLNLWAVTA